MSVAQDIVCLQMHTELKYLNVSQKCQIAEVPLGLIWEQRIESGPFSLQAV